MKKNYLLSIFAVVLSMMAMSMAAQTTAYVGVKSLTSDWKEGYGMNGCIFSFDTADPSTVKEVVFKLEPLDAYGMEDALFIQSGTSAGDKYYAMCKSEFETENSFCTLNFATGNKTILGDGCEYLNDMAYDATNNILYGVEYTSDDVNVYSALYSIDKGTGELTTVYNIPEIQIVSIATDGGQNLYGIGLQSDGVTASLYLIDPANEQTSKLYDLGEITQAFSYSLDYYKEMLYLIAGKSFITIDPKTGTMNISDNKLPSTPYLLAGLCFTKSTADGSIIDDPEPPVNTKKVRVVETWGDVMGDETGCTKKEVTYYDGDNKPMRQCEYGKLLGSNNWQISSYTTYFYNDQKQLLRVSSEQYGLYDGEDLAFRAVADTITYEYDDKGRLSKETMVNSDRYTTYEYDETGNLVKKARFNLDRYDEYEGDYYVMESYEYSDFIAPDCPQLIKGDGAYDSYKTLCRVTYDSDNNKISAKTYDVSGEILRRAEYWTYENGMLALYEDKKVKNNGDGTCEELNNNRTVYSLDNNNPNRIKTETFSYFDNEWSGVPYYKVTETAEFDGLYSTELKIEEVTDQLNTVKLSFTVPNIPAFGGFAFDIYRHGIKIARVLLTDEGAFDPETSTLSYVDKEVKNGLYDYFVQTVVLSEMGDEEETFNISNIISQNIFLDLPAVNNVRYISHRTENSTYFVTVGWDAPESLDPDLGFQRYNVFVKGFKVAENREDEGLETTYEVDFGDISLSASKAKEIIIESVFKFGKVRTEPTLIDIESVGLESNEWSNIIQRNGDKILINSDNVSVDVISLSGALLNKYHNTKCIDLSTLDSGIYLVKVIYNGKMNVLKLMK